MIRPIHILKLATLSLIAVFATNPANAQQQDHFRYLELEASVAPSATSAAASSAVRPGPIEATTAPGASGVVSDDFSSPSLESIWTFVNPLGDASVAVNGTQAVLDVPATGSIHDVWTSENTLPRIMQDVSDSDFEVVAKYESTLPSGSFASQGILIEQSDLDVIRAEFHRYGSQSRIFVVSLFGGGFSIKVNNSISLSTPMYLRVGRAGNNWTVAYSSDGSNYTTAASFSQAMTVSRVGVFAGNAADTPVTALVDYFFESSAPIDPEDGPGDVTPPVISNLQVAPTLDGAVVTWNTDEPATSRVDYGLDSGYGSFEESSSLVTSHQVTLTGLMPDTEYHFSASSADFYSNTASTADDVFTTLPDVTAPVISNVVVVPSTTGATVTWNTNEPATSRVDYGLDAGYGQFEEDGTLKTSHSVQLSGLSSSTTYHFSITSIDAYANPASTADDTFTTEDVDVTPPVISNLVVTPTSDGAVITWDTDEPATSRVDYGSDAGYGSFEESLTLVTSHQLTITGLGTGVEQHFMVTSTDAEANSASTADDTFTTQTDSTPPVISNVQVVPTAYGATVTWNTDEPASSRVDYGADAGYGSSEQSGALVTSHSIQIVGLAPEATYHFSVTSEDAETNSASSSDDTFSTTAVPTTTGTYNFGLTAVDAFYPGNGRPGWSSSGDIDQDGLIDVVAGGGDALQWYEAPTWTRHSIELGSTVGGNGGVVVDVDRDGDLDVVTTLYLSNLVWFENPGPAMATQPWTRRTIDGTSPLGFGHDLIAVDLDNDGEDEYVALYVGDGGVAWYDVPANPAVDPWPKTVILGATVDPFVGLAAGDLDGDGDNDVVISNSWYENDGPATPNWTARTIFAEDVQNVVVYDVDQDGRNDVVGAQGFSSPGMVMWGQGPALKSDPWVVNVVDVNLDGPENVWAGDLNNDGFTDIVTGEMESSDGFDDAGSNLIAYSGTAVAGVDWTKEYLATNVGVSARINPVDIDADGDLDFLADGNAESHIYLWENGPEIPTGSGFVSDDFSAPGLNTALWTFVDPLSDGSSVSVNGTQALIDVPATGTPHEAWATVNTVPRLMQDVDNADFEVEAKFESGLGSGGGFQSQGIMIEQDPSTFLRIEFYRSGNKRRVLVGSIGGGSGTVQASVNTTLSTPMYLRVGRVGDQFTASYSLDGTNFSVAASFNFPMTVTRIGVHAGNDATTPHTALVDYIFDTASPIVPEDGGGGSDVTPPIVSNVQVSTTPVGATITWDTNEPATSRVDYGLDAGYGSFEEDLALVTSHSVALSGLSPDTEYHFQVTSTDASANSASTGDATFMTDPEDLTDPVISNVLVVPSGTGATVTWNTDEPATSRVDFGLDAGYGSFEEDLALVTSHSVELTGLVSETEYHYQITSGDASGNTATTSDATFMTTVAPGLPVSDDFSAPALDTALWTFVDPLGDGSSVSVNGTQAVIDVPATGTPHEAWATVNTVPRLMQDVDDTDFEVEAKFESGLGSGSGFQSQGIMIEQDAATFLRVEFYRSGNKRRVLVGSIGGGSGTVQASVNTSLSTPMYLRVGRVGDQFTASYSLDGTNFSVAASFNFPMTVTRVGVHAGNDTSTPHTALVDYFFETASPIVPEDGGGGSDITPPVVSNVQVATTPVGATITWNTDEPATSRVDYGLDSGYGSFEEDLALVTSHSVALSGLSPDTEYHFQVTSTDASANGTSTSDATFTTDPEDLTDPVISNVLVVPTYMGATVTWNTDEPATSRVDFGLDAGYGSFEEDLALVTSHSVELTGLVSETEYHYQITSADVSGNAATTSDATFMTTEAPSLPESDDFSSPTLDTSLWTFVDPLGDAAFGLTGTQAMIEVPQNGAIHSVWTDSNTLPRLMQTVANTDFEVEAKFESDLGFGDGFQGQGILVEQDPLNVLRIEFYRSGNKRRVFVATIMGGNANILLNQNVSMTTPMYLRVGRVGDQWTVSYSFNGTSFTQGVSFNQPMTVSSVGIYAGNDEFAPHTMIADYFFEASAPIAPEDGGAGSDATPPVVSNVQVDVTSSTATLTWQTDEPATSRVDYGLDAGYGSFVEDPLLTMINHRIVLTGLTPGTEYHFQVSSEDGTGNIGSTADDTFTTIPSLDNPLVDVWYGDTQEFGLLGRHQEWVNILGRVTDLDGMGTLTYTLNGGSSMPLTLGPDDRRLVDDGDFNVEIDYDDLVPGANQIQITATDLIGNVTVKNVTVNYTSGNVWPLPYSVDWSVVTDVQDPGKVVDGEWSVGGGELHTVQLGYDRLYGAGDLTWDDYEVTVPFTVNAIDSVGFTLPISGNGAHLGIILRWPGHSARGNAQPRYYWLPNGGVGGYTWYADGVDDKFTLAANGTTVDEDLTGRTLPLGVPHIIRMRVETLPGGEPYYSFKIWAAADSEPAGWDLEGAGQVGDPTSGGFLIVAHHIDISVGDLDFAPVSGTSSRVAGDYTTERGDVTGDGSVGESDAVALLDEITAAHAWTSSELRTTDVSGNGGVTAYDAALIRGYDPTRTACPLGNCVTASRDILVHDTTASSGGSSAATSRWSGASPFVKSGGSKATGVLGWREAEVSGRVIRIPLEVSEVAGLVTAAQVIVPVDERKIKLTAVESLLPDDWHVSYRQHDDRIVMAMAGTTPLRSGALLNLEFTQDSPGPMLTFAGTGFLNEGAAVELNGVVAGIVPNEFALMPNYPNPFGETTRIAYSLPEAQLVKISVYNMLGQHVATLADADQEAGAYEVSWNGRDATGQRVASGVYLYRLEAGAHVEQRTMIILR